MPVLWRTDWRRCLTGLIFAVVSIGAVAVSATPADARVFIGFGVGAPVGWGYYAAPPYYGYPYYGYYPYAPAYYGYPGFFIGIGPYRHWHHHRHW